MSGILSLLYRGPPDQRREEEGDEEIGGRRKEGPERPRKGMKRAWTPCGQNSLRPGDRGQRAETLRPWRMLEKGPYPGVPVKNTYGRVGERQGRGLFPPPEDLRWKVLPRQGGVGHIPRGLRVLTRR